jgi:hypothetical protein
MSQLLSQIPYITKFTADSVLYDAIGESTESHLCVYTFDRYSFILMNSNGTCVRYDNYTENLSTFVVNKVNTDSVYSICEYKGEIYGFNGYQATKFYNNTVLYIQDNTKLVQESFDGVTKYIHLSSASQIRDLFVDEDYNYYVLHSTNHISKYNKDRSLIYSFSIRNLVNSVFYDIGVSTNSNIELIKIDYVREYTSNGLSSYPIILGSIDNTKNLFLMKIDEVALSASYVNFLTDHNNSILRGEYIPFGNPNKVNYNLTNYEFLKNKYNSKNKFIFKIILKNLYNNKDIFKLEVPLSTDKFVSEKHHFAFRMDSRDGIISIFQDGELIHTEYIAPGRYVFQDVIYESMNIGNTYFGNRSSLDKYIDQSGYYFVKNLEIQQFKMYNKSLTDNEVKFLTLNNTKVDDLVISLPTGQRNGIDTIVRQFKLDVGGAKSNKINLIIKNSGLTSPVLQNKMSEIIMSRINKIIPVTTQIMNIEYRN